MKNSFLLVAIIILVNVFTSCQKEAVEIDSTSQVQSTELQATQQKIEIAIDALVARKEQKNTTRKTILTTLQENPHAIKSIRTSRMGSTSRSTVSTLFEERDTVIKTSYVNTSAVSLEKSRLNASCQYTAKLTPIEGDIDLFIIASDGENLRLIKESINNDLEAEELSIALADMQPQETTVFFVASLYKSATATFLWELTEDCSVEDEGIDLGGIFGGGLGGTNDDEGEETTASINGTWSSAAWNFGQNIELISALDWSVDYTFGNDNTFSYVLTLGNGNTLEDNGTWEMDGDALTLTYQEFSINEFIIYALLEVEETPGTQETFDVVFNENATTMNLIGTGKFSDINLSMERK